MRRSAAAVVAWLLAVILLACGTTGRESIVIGSKNFTEQVILGEMLAKLVADRSGLQVDRRLNLGGTFVCHKALAAGELDLYVEYTGTALAAILKMESPADPGTVLNTVREEYKRRFGATWMAPLGFDNTFVIVVRPQDAGRLGLRSISDLAKVSGRLRAGFGYEFAERADGARGLAAAYGLAFGGISEMDLGLIYRALVEGQVDAVAGSATDGQIDALGLVVLEDDRRFFPPYQAAVVVRDEALARVPGLASILEEISGRISDAQMRRMNSAVDSGSRSARAVALEYLQRELPRR